MNNEIEIQNIDHLGIVAVIIDAIGLVEIITELIPSKKGEKVSSGHVVKAMILHWELWLAREIVQDRPLPWQKSLINLTPGRVAQAMPGVLAVIGTPACSPKLRGKSPGWPTGHPRSPRTDYPIVKKGFSRTKKTSKS